MSSLTWLTKSLLWAQEQCAALSATISAFAVRLCFQLVIFPRIVAACHSAKCQERAELKGVSVRNVVRGLRYLSTWVPKWRSVWRGYRPLGGAAFYPVSLRWVLRIYGLALLALPLLCFLLVGDNVITQLPVSATTLSLSWWTPSLQNQAKINPLFLKLLLAIMFRHSNRKQPIHSQ